MPRRQKSNMDFARDIAKSVAVAAIIGCAGALISTYLEVRDLRHDVQTVSGKLDWLYKHEFPEE